MKLLKLSVVALTAFLAVGCASTSDIDNLQSQINTMKTDVAGAKDAANSANTAATDAAARAASAESAAKRAADTADQVNTKLDRLFKHSMQK